METKCGWDGYECDGQPGSSGYCRKHYSAMWQRARRAASALPPRPCEVCGTEFRPREEKGRYCSSQCKNRRRTPTVVAAVAEGRTVPPTPTLVDCSVCGKTFTATRRGKGGGLKKYCSNRCGMQANHYWRLYGLTVQQVRTMREAGCAVCGRTDNRDGSGRSILHIDHCHDSGRVRGVLCQKCNVGIGQLGDDPAMLRRAAEYLER